MHGADQFFSYTAQMGTMTTGHDPSAAAADFGLGPIGNPLAAMAASSFLGQNGMYPGQFFPTHNLADLVKADVYRTQQQAAVSKAMATTDVSTWLDTTGGAMRMMGMPFGLQQRAAFRQSYAAAAPMLSMLAQMAPELVDSLHGSRGSAAVMAANLFRGGQYRLDSSGLPGMSGESINGLQATIEDQLYSSPSRIAGMRGVGMGQLGQIFDESSRRGYLPGSIGARSRGAQIKAISQEEGIATEALEAMDSADFGSKLRSFDSKRISGRLKEMAGAVSAMRELFGSQGQANAPMAQIINALEAMTQNRLASMSGAQVESLVRKTKAVAENTGISIDSLLHLTAQSAAMGDPMGMDRSLAIRIGHSSATFGTGYKNAFGSSFSAFGAASPEEVVARETKLRTQAAMSEQARFAGATIRSVEALGVGADTEAGQFAAALRRGDTEFKGQSMFRLLTQSNLQNMMRNSGVNAAGLQAFGTAMHDEFGNQEYIEKHGLERMVRKLQGEELANNSGRIAGEGAVQQALIASGVAQPQAAAMARQVGGGLLQAMFNSESPEAISTAANRQKLIEAELTKTMGAAQAAKLAPAVALSFESRMNDQAKFYKYGDFTKMLQSHNKNVLQQGEFTEQMANIDADISQALSPLGKAGPIQRVMDLIQGGKSDEDITAMLGKALGGVDIGQVHALTRDQEEFRRLSAKPNKTAQEVAAAQALFRSIRGRVGDIVTSSSTTIKGTMAAIAEGKTDEEIQAQFGGQLKGIAPSELRQLRTDRVRIQELQAKAERTKAEEQELSEKQSRVDAVEGKIADVGLAGDIGRQVSDTDVERAVKGFDALGAAIADQGGSPEARRSKIDQEARHGLARANNIVQGLYTDKASMRKLGVGGVDRLKSIEGKYTQMLRLVGGDTDLLAKALSGDSSVPEALRNKLQGLAAGLGSELSDLHSVLSGEGNVMTPAEEASEKEALSRVLKEREASDETQKSSLTDRLAKAAGMDPKNLSAEDKEKLHGMLGSYGDTKRQDLMLAMEAQERISAEAARTGKTVEELMDSGVMESDFAQAGGLATLNSAPGASDIHSLTAALGTFEEANAAKGANTAKPSMELSGTLTIKNDGTGEFTGEGVTDMGGMA